VLLTTVVAHVLGGEIVLGVINAKDVDAGWMDVGNADADEE
jgi:hypothetical protein